LLKDVPARMVDDRAALRAELDAALDAARHDPDADSVAVAGPVARRGVDSAADLPGLARISKSKQGSVRRTPGNGG